MTHLAEVSTELPLRERELAHLVERAAGPGAQVRSVRRSRYATSYPLFDLEAVGPAGEVAMMVKDLRWTSLSEDGRRAKLASEHDPRREIGVYRDLLPEVDGPPVMKGGRGDRRSGTAWLAIERIDGAELYQWGDPEVWGAAARWLGAFHRHWRGREREWGSSPRRLPLLQQDAAYFARLSAGVRRSREPGPAHDVVDDVLRAWGRAADDLSGQVPTLSHGECYASNVLVTSSGRVAVVDWETAAVASGWSDLAALVAGWPDGERELWLEQYLSAGWPPSAMEGGDPRRLLDAARLQLCIQWLGADPRWQPPSEHRTDWLREAVGILERAPWPW